MKQHSSFKGALQAFENNPFRLYGDPPLDAADISHLRHWSQHPGCEKIWQRLSGRLCEGESWFPTMILLIKVVLAIRNEAESREKELAALKKSGAEPGKAALARLKRITKAAAGKATDWRERARLFQQAADFCTEISRSRRMSGVIAVDRNGSRKRQRFSARLSKHLHLLAGQWCDAEVATLTEIAFSGKEITIDMVRAARRRPLQHA
jgi:hypothetical protein